MKSSDFRAEARSKMAGKWSQAVSTTLLYCFTFFCLGAIQGALVDILSEISNAIISLLIYLVEIPLAFGLTSTLLKLYKSEETNILDTFKLGFSNFGKSWATALRMLLKLLLPIIFLIVSIFLMTFGFSAAIFSAAAASISNANLAPSGAFLIFSIIGLILYVISLIWTIVKSYYYSLSFVILADKPELTAKEAVEESRKLMTGNRGKLFVLQLSFFGWALLSVLSFGIGLLWLLPYIQFATFAFYKKLSEDNGSVETVTEDSKIGE